MKRYYYLLSSLKELQLEPDEDPLPVKNFLEFCNEVMERKEFESVKRLFLLNDIRNAVAFKKGGDTYSSPSYYLEDEFIQNLADKERFFPFLQRYFNSLSSNTRVYPDLNEMDEAAAYFYEELTQQKNTFHKEYYLFELNLRNLTTFLSLRKHGDGLNQTQSSGQSRLPLVPFGSFYEDLLKNTLPDFGIGDESTYLAGLSEVFNGTDSVKIEKAIDVVRWEWLNSWSSRDYFSLNAVYAYAVKLSILGRWNNLQAEKGQALFDNLVNMIQRAVRFSIEILTAGDKKI